MQGEMPLLRHLTLSYNGFYHRATKGPPAILEHAPLLTSVVLGASFMVDCMQLPWGNLTYLEARCFFEYECTYVLRAATNLVYCKLNIIQNQTSMVAASVPVHLHLRNFILCPEDHNNVWQWGLFDSLTLPALRTLQIPQPNTPLDSLRAFLLRSQCTLEELRITGATSTEAVFREVLPAVGTIKVEPV
ncbi:hypothetical protein B0H16DRAFT_1539209 [Mycena metata]|uniref:Uncharacterized protein n=1 Tax=Mycena metata TaxID=1033252 RepID=A0AAD7J4L8_9AGAR|nr:hypothetical protein B0H16DRAFT_1539209 [Mycena metata]